MPGDLCGLLRRCRAEDAIAWEHLAAWVKARGRAVLGGIGKLSGADDEDVIAEALKSLVTVVRRGGIRGTSNAEIDAYVCAAIRNRALNVLRGRARRRGAGETTPGTVDTDPASSGARDEALDEASPQDLQAIAAEQLERAEKLLLSWPEDDRYLFIAKLHGVPARIIQATLERPPFESFSAVTTVDTRFYRLRKRLMEHILER